MTAPDRHEPPPLDRPSPDGDGHTDRSVELPAPDVRRTRFPFPIVWVVPLIAALAAGYYLYGIYKDRGVEIAITFADASNLRVRDTPLNYHGVRVGSVSRIELNEDRTRGLVHVRLDRAYQDTIARDGAKFWLVRPDAGGGMLSGLSTVITGPYIDCVPGGGELNYRFEGLDDRPVRIGEGVRLVLHTDRLSHLGVQSPVYFRGLQVGNVQDIRFSANATHVNVTIFVWKRYAKLLRPGSRFWSVSGTDIKGGLLSGISVEVNNIKALLAGGVAFATPDDGDARPVPDGADFVLHDAPDKDWLDWSVPIPLAPDDNPGQPDPGPMPQMKMP